MIFATKVTEAIGKTNSFHNFQDFWNYVLDFQSLQAIVPEIMETMETISFANSVHGFCYEFHGNSEVFWQRSFAKIVVFQCL